MNTDASSVPISSLAKVIRSKNAGPFQITVDFLFPDLAAFELVRASGVIDRETVAAAYGVPLDRVAGVYYWESARAVKVTIDRTASAGSPGDLDCYGAQQHAPLLRFRVPLVMSTATTDDGVV